MQRVDAFSEREDVQKFYTPNRRSDFVTENGTLISFAARLGADS